MKNLFLISEEEKKRILTIHESATKNQYLLEQSNSLTTTAKQIAAQLAQSTQDEGFMASVSSLVSGGIRSGWGTDEGKMVAAIKKITSKQLFLEVQKYLPNYYFEGKTIQSLLNNELESDDINSVSQIQKHLTKIGITCSYKDDIDGSGNKIYIAKSFSIKPPTATTTAVNNDWSKFPCVKATPGATLKTSQKGNQFYEINKDQYYAWGEVYKADKNKSKYYCDGNNIKLGEKPKQTSRTDNGTARKTTTQTINYADYGI